MRDYDRVGRYGGEEFLILLPGCEGNVAIETVERARAIVANSPIEVPSGKLPMTISAGVSWTWSAALPDALIEAADAAMYRAKQHGRNRVES